MADGRIEDTREVFKRDLKSETLIKLGLELAFFLVRSVQRATLREA